MVLSGRYQRQRQPNAASSIGMLLEVHAMAVRHSLHDIGGTSHHYYICRPRLSSWQQSLPQLTLMRRVSSRKKDRSWSAPSRLILPTKAGPSHCPPMALPPLWAGLRTTSSTERCG